ncbi:MAG TPA: DUF2149 domain-containing protein [Solirubrobacterales bacterium]
MKVTARARSRDDRAGDPLDGLVNLFDLGIVLSVAFLLAALSSLNLTDELTSKSKAEATRPPDAVVASKSQKVEEVQLKSGKRVVGQGKPVGTLYRLSDGRTVLVKEGGAERAQPFRRDGDSASSGSTSSISGSSPSTPKTAR